jgi:hypothetical protein
MKKTYLYSVKLVETSMHSCTVLVTEEGRGSKKNRMKKGREGEKREE